jgi:hypothetical protein
MMRGWAAGPWRLFQDPAFEVEALFENHPGTSLWRPEIG